MNKRIKKKKMKNDVNKEIGRFLKEIDNSVSVKVDKINYVFDFLFKYNAVVYLKFNDLKEWQIALLVYKDKLVLFGEHVSLIDKFKPSRTHISKEIRLDSYEQDLNKSVELLTDVIREPKKHLVYSLNSITPTKKELDEQGISFDDYINEAYESFMKEEKRLEDIDLKQYHLVRGLFKDISKDIKGIQHVVVKDGNKNGWRRSPRYYVSLVLTNEKYDDFSEIKELIEEKKEQLIERLNGDYLLHDFKFDMIYDIDYYNHFNCQKHFDYIY